MASSTSSERAFSSAGITISKRRNRLKADIVEALQYLKSCIHHSLLFRESPSSVVECRVYGADLDLETCNLKTEKRVAASEDQRSWDELIEDDDEI